MKSASLETDRRAITAWDFVAIYPQSQKKEGVSLQFQSGRVGVSPQVFSKSAESKKLCNANSPGAVSAVVKPSPLAARRERRDPPQCHRLMWVSTGSRGTGNAQSATASLPRDCRMVRRGGILREPTTLFVLFDFRAKE